MTIGRRGNSKFFWQQCYAVQTAVSSIIAAKRFDSVLQIVEASDDKHQGELIGAMLSNSAAISEADSTGAIGRNFRQSTRCKRYRVWFCSTSRSVGRRDGRVCSRKPPGGVRALGRA